MNLFKKKPKLGLIPEANSPLLYRIVAAGITPDIWTAPKLPTIGNQAVQNCFNWALSYCHEMATGEVYSKGYLYGERAPEDWQGQGLVPTQALANAKKYGNVPLEKFNREEEVDYAQSVIKMLSGVLRPCAANYPIKAYYVCSNVNEIRTARMNGLGVIFGAAVDRETCDAKGVFRAEDGRLGYHAMTIIDWSINNPAPWRVANSWGKNWGVDGFCYMTDADILRTGMVYAVEFATPLADCPNCPPIIIPAPAGEEEPTPVVPIGTRRTLKYTYPRMKDENGYTDVSEFQKLCNKIGIPCNIDGYYGTNARAACLKLQATVFGQYADEIDGIVAGNTWAALDNLVAQEEADNDGVIEDEEDEGTVFGPIFDLIKWAKEQVGQMYLLGAQGEKVYDGMEVRGKTYTAQEWIRYRERKSDEYYYKALAFYNILVSKGKAPILAYDCSGLLVCWLLKNGIIDEDMNAHTLYNRCKAHKGCTTDHKKLRPGWFCFVRKWTGAVTHVGLYIGAAEIDGVKYSDVIIESKGRADGVVMTPMRDGGKLNFNRFGCLPELDDAI